jgi:hypothetical protein
MSERGEAQARSARPRASPHEADAHPFVQRVASKEAEG